MPSIVRKLLTKLKGQTPAVTPPVVVTPAVAPPLNAALLGELTQRMLNLVDRAQRENLTLGNTVAGRRVAIKALLDADDYAQAKTALDGLQGELQQEIDARQRVNVAGPQTREVLGQVRSTLATLRDPTLRQPLADTLNRLAEAREQALARPRFTQQDADLVPTARSIAQLAADAAEAARRGEANSAKAVADAGGQVQAHVRALNEQLEASLAEARTVVDAVTDPAARKAYGERLDKLLAAQAAALKLKQAGDQEKGLTGVAQAIPRLKAEAGALSAQVGAKVASQAQAEALKKSTDAALAELKVLINGITDRVQRKPHADALSALATQQGVADGQTLMKDRVSQLQAVLDEGVKLKAAADKTKLATDAAAARAKADAEAMASERQSGSVGQMKAQVEAAVNEVSAEVGKIADPAAKAPLDLRVAKFKADLEAALKLATPAAQEKALAAISPAVARLNVELAGAAYAPRNIQRVTEDSLKQCTTLLAAIQTDLAGLPASPLKTDLEAQAKVLADGRAAVTVLDTPASRDTAVDLASKAVALSTTATTTKTQYAAYVTERAKVASVIDRVRPLLGPAGAAPLQLVLDSLKLADEPAATSSYKHSKSVVLKKAIKDARDLRVMASALAAYEPERKKVAVAIRALEAHPQAAAIASEVAAIKTALTAANLLRRKKPLGPLKGLTALKLLPPRCEEARQLAERLQATVARLPELMEKFKTSSKNPDITPEVKARYAQKLLVQEGCTDDEAVAMAEDAASYTKDGLTEKDALMSSRVKQSLEKDGVAEPVAKAIGKNLRAGGSAQADDAKALAQGMKNFSPAVLDKLTQAGITTICCRGPATEIDAGSAGEAPRGWPAGMTWDDVPGMYDPSGKQIIVGTMDDGNGKRKVPGSGEGPIAHGTPDLIGHEAGHAFDATDPVLKSTNSAFLAARNLDKTSGKLKGNATGGQDDYFLTVLEGGTNDAGATSETFAESFAMHFGSITKRWPDLESFWSANPWGV